MITVLEAVIQSHNPIPSIWRVHERGRLQDITFGTDVAFLPFAQHVSLPELWDENAALEAVGDMKTNEERLRTCFIANSCPVERSRTRETTPKAPGRGT